MGGLSRRAYMIKQIESEVNKPVLLLDGGALLFEEPTIPAQLLPARTAQARGVGRAMRAMRYAAIGTAPQDLAAGLAFLVQQRKESDLPLLSANLLDPAGKKPFKPSLLRKIGETTVAVIGLTGGPAGSPPAGADRQYRLLPWQDVLPDLLKQIKGRAEMVILLSSLPESDNRAIAAQFPDIQLIIQAGGAPVNKVPELVGNTLITQVGPRGKYLGRLDIDWKPSHRWGQGPLAALQLQQDRDNLQRVAWRLENFEKTQPTATEREKDNGYRQLRQEQARLQEEMGRLEQAAAENQQALSAYTSTFVPLRAALAEDPEVRKIVAETKQAVNGAGKLGSQPQEGKPRSGGGPRP